MTTDLKPHADRVSQTSLKALADARASSAPLRAAGWSIDLSRHYLDAEAEAGLLQFGRVSDLQSAADSLFAGDIVNPSESRPALHWALRAQSELSGEAETVRQSVLPALSFARDVVSGSVTSSTGLPFNAVLHIGIGGSDFGPRLIADAFEDKASGNIDLRFCANVDPFDLDRAMHGLDPTRTLVIGVSKSFGTEETLYNLARARTWLEESVGDQSQRMPPCAWPCSTIGTRQFGTKRCASCSHMRTGCECCRPICNSLKWNRMARPLARRAQWYLVQPLRRSGAAKDRLASTPTINGYTRAHKTCLANSSSLQIAAGIRKALTL